MSDITEKDVMKYCYSRNLMLVTKESLEYMHRPIVIETMDKNAIPIEWIKDYILRTWLTDYDSPELKNIERMLNDWREEAENEN